MYYEKLLESVIKSEQNPINKMYLHEIKMKWIKFAKIPKNENNDEIIQFLNDFLKTLRQRKFNFEKKSGKGFKKSSAIFSVDYLKDLLSVFINRSKILDNNPAKWGIQSFSTNLKFNPADLTSMKNNPSFEATNSPHLMQLVQQIDAQFRTTGKRNFSKYNLSLPLIVFHIFKSISEDEFIKCNYIANLAKSTFAKSKNIIVVEHLDFVPEIKKSSIDAMFILKKDFPKNDEISIDVVNALEKNILKYLTKDEQNLDFQKTGILI